jgi:hypothetical protein
MNFSFPLRANLIQWKQLNVINTNVINPLMSSDRVSSPKSLLLYDLAYASLLLSFGLMLSVPKVTTKGGLNCDSIISK